MRCAVLAVALGCSALDVGNGRQAIIGGAPAPDEVAVVGLARHPVSCGNDIVIDCSATLVGPRAVVTAAHCVGSDPPNVYQVFFGASVDGGGVVIPVASGRTHPDFDPATFANDIAVLILADDAPATIAPIAMRTAALPDLAGTDVTVAGFGVTAIDAQDTGVRFAGTARVTAVGVDEIDTAPGPALACNGDSGGPLLAGGELIGVSTHGDAACAQVGHAQRVDRQQAFIAVVLADAVGGARRPFDPTEAFCTATCASDADCPADTMCFALGDQPRHCVYRGLPAGTFDEPCPGGAAACVTVPDGSCRRFVACSEQPPDDGCDCSTSSPSAAWWWLVLAWLVRTLGSRRAAR